MRLRVGVTRRPIVSPIYPRARPLTDRAFTSTMARRVFRDHPAYVGPYQPTYFARPYYYAPYPYGVPAPFFLGFAYLPYY